MKEENHFIPYVRNYKEYYKQLYASKLHNVDKTEKFLDIPILKKFKKKIENLTRFTSN